jgi:uncharacterized membrane protein YjjP (DUF1212 family)
MSLYFAVTISLIVFFGGLIIAVLSSYLSFRVSNPQVSNRFNGKIIYKKRRKGKYILNNFTAKIFFAEMERNKRVKVINGSSPLTTEKYSFIKTKIFDN